MKDFLGQEVAVGDTVVFTAYGGTGLCHGVIIKVSAKTVQIKTDSHWGGQTRKGSDYFIKVQVGVL